MSQDKLIKTLEFKLSLNATQAAMVDSWLDVQRWVWNRGLGLLKEFEAFTFQNEHDGAYAPCCPVPWDYRWVPNDGKDEWRDAAIVASYSHKWRPVPLPLVTEKFPGQRSVSPAQCPLLQAIFEQDCPPRKGRPLSAKVEKGEVLRAWPSVTPYRKPYLLTLLEQTPMTQGGVIRRGKVTVPRARDWSHALSEAMQHSTNPRLSDSTVPAKVTQTTIKRLSQAWGKYIFRKRDALGRLAGCPQFKPMKGDRALNSISNENPGPIAIKGQCITLSGTAKTLGTLNVKGLGKRWPEGTPVKSYRIKREPSGYYLLLVGELPREVAKPSEKVVGFDAGVVHILNDDAGHPTDIPSPLKRRLKKIKRLSRKAARQEKGSKNQAKTYANLALTHEKVRRDRKGWHHKLSTFAVRKYAGIAVEDLKLANMTKRPKAKPNVDGTGYERNMATAKAGLNRAMLDAGFGGFYAIMEAKSKAFGREFVRVPPQYTSQTCNACGEVHKASRLSQSAFVCVGCGHTDNADTNAARNIRDTAFPEQSGRYPTLVGGTSVKADKAAFACETQGQQTVDSSTPQGDALAISPLGASPIQRDTLAVANFQSPKPSNLVSSRRRKRRSAQAASESGLQLGFWDAAAETG
jgi:transposase